MMARASLKRLIARTLKDAGTLLANRRYAGCIYLSGYAIELALKLEICRMLKFREGYPETAMELACYAQRVEAKVLMDGKIESIRDLKIHDLERLLKYSGRQIDVGSGYQKEWWTIRNWSAALRYDPAVVRRAQAAEFHLATIILVSVFKNSQP